MVLMYDVSYAHKAGEWISARRQNQKLTKWELAEEVHKALKAQISLPVVMSHIDRRVNHSSKKGKGREEDDESAYASAAPAPAADGEDEVNTTPADGVSDLAPAPTPEGLVPSPHLPSQPAPPRIAFTLPDGVESIEGCAIFYLGGESLALNNLLMTHGRCKVSVGLAVRASSVDGKLTIRRQVWSYDATTREARLESGKTNRMLMRRYAVVEKAKDADVIGILVGTLGVCSSFPICALSSHH